MHLPISCLVALFVKSRVYFVYVLVSGVLVHPAAYISTWTMEGESEPLLSRATLEPDAVDKPRKGMSHSVHLVYAVRRSTVKCVGITRHISYPE